jgi:hypothetical protein
MIAARFVRGGVVAGWIVDRWSLRGERRVVGEGLVDRVAAA